MASFSFFKQQTALGSAVVIASLMAGLSAQAAPPCKGGTTTSRAMANGRVVHENVSGETIISERVISPSALSTQTGDDIVDTAVKAGSFNTLAAALTAADLVATLKGPGPFTVFAPTDEAFAKLPAGTVETLLKPENKGKLKEILLLHVVPGSVSAAEVVKLNSAKTAGGRTVLIDTDGGVKVATAKGSANVVKTDIKARNGLIHVIDSVLLP